jgi:hypothetical protein
MPPSRRRARSSRCKCCKTNGRVGAGVYYASDAEADIALGALLFTELENKPEFENDLTAALTNGEYL